uniref:Uncharacterized protein n=1 Tax=Rhizophora mucronata TaxID=61149 RepID=A0A2P2N8R4_RHIMU
MLTANQKFQAMIRQANSASAQLKYQVLNFLSLFKTMVPE